MPEAHRIQNWERFPHESDRQLHGRSQGAPPTRIPAHQSLAGAPCPAHARIGHEPSGPDPVRRRPARARRELGASCVLHAHAVGTWALEACCAPVLGMAHN